MKVFKGNSLNIVLFILMTLTTMISYRYYQIKLIHSTYKDIELAYEFSLIEMNTMQYLRYCLSQDLEIESNDFVNINVIDDEIDCILIKEEMRVHFIVYLNDERNAIKKIKFI